MKDKLLYRAIVDDHDNVDISESTLDDIEIIYDQKGSPTEAIINHKKWPIEILEGSSALSYRISVCGILFSIQLQRPVDIMVEKMGYSSKVGEAERNIKAPMPGRIANLSVSPGEEIKEGQVLLSLEAMKMENVVKSNVTGKVRKIHIKMDDTVAKNQLLIEID